MKFTDWKKLITSKEPSDRSEAAENLPDADDEKVIPFLLKAIKDNDALVRACILDALKFFPDKKVQQALREQIKKETDELAKGYALGSLGRIGEIDDIITLLNILKNAPIPRIQVHAALGVCLGIQNISFLKLQSLIENQDDEIRCTTYNAIIYIIENFNEMASQIETHLQKRLKMEKYKIHFETLEKALAAIKNISGKSKSL